MPIEHGGDLFAVAREHGWDWREVLDFSASINPLGPAPGVRSAICHAVERIEHYPEREPVKLRRALAQTWNVAENQLLLGNGATELIFFLARAWSVDSVTLAAPVFSEFHRAFPEARLADLRLPKNWGHDGLLVLTRPANPTGYELPLDALIEHLTRHNRPVLIDESFLEFSALESASKLIEHFPQLVILRSLTKFYALPGLRIGALISSSETIQGLRRQREPWQVNVLAEEAALAALADHSHAERSVQFVNQEREWMRHQLSQLPGVAACQGSANFLYVRLSHEAASLCSHLLKYKILIRNCANWPGLTVQAVRIAIRRRDQNQCLLEAWREFPCA